jgi:hypothetical protein
MQLRKLDRLQCVLAFRRGINVHAARLGGFVLEFR